MNLLDADLVVARLLPPDLGVDGAEVCPSSSSVPSSRATKACFRLLEDLLNNKYVQQSYELCLGVYYQLLTLAAQPWNFLASCIFRQTALQLKRLKYHAET